MGNTPQHYSDPEPSSLTKLTEAQGRLLCYRREPTMADAPVSKALLFLV
jgi:hypothetical protein